MGEQDGTIQRGYLQGSFNEIVWGELWNMRGAFTMLGLYHGTPNSQQELEDHKCNHIVKRSKSKRIIVVV